MSSRSRPVLVGVTGGIGTGKSIVCKVLSIFGYPVYDADSRAKALMNESELIRKKVIELFGKDSYNENNTLNRELIASKAFHDSTLLVKLNEIVHPEVGRDFKEWIANNAAKQMLVKEAALLVEAGSYKELDYLIVINSPLEIRIKRILERDPHRTKKDVEAIIGKQMDSKELETYADFIILNDEKSSILKQVFEVVDAIKDKSRLDSQPA